MSASFRRSSRERGLPAAPVGDSDLAEDMVEVVLHCHGGYEHALGDLGVGETFSDELNDVALPRRQAGPAAGRSTPLAAPSARVSDGLRDRETGSL